MIGNLRRNVIVWLWIEISLIVANRSSNTSLFFREYFNLGLVSGFDQDARPFLRPPL